MKTITKRLLTAVLCAVFMLSFCLFSSALSTNEYGLGLSVEAQETSLTLKLKNSNSFDVDGISIDFVLPDGLVFKDEGKSVADITLKAGEAYENSFSFMRTDIPASAPADKADSVLPAVVTAAVVVAAVAVIALLAIRKKRAAALMLAVLMLTPCTGIFGVHAIGVKEERSFTLTENITINEKSYPVSVTVSYLADTAENSRFDFAVAENPEPDSKETVTRLTTDFSGTATANGTVKAVTYEIKSEATADTQTGSAELDGCEWKIEKLALKPGENEVVIKAELENGETQTKTYSLNYDRGELYSAKASEVKEDNGTKYIDNVINIYFENGVSDERMDEILSEQGLARIGESNSIFLVQARANEDSLEALRAKCAEIQSYDEVSLAQIEEVLNIELNAVPNDPWYSDPTAGSQTWDESSPGGNNWSSEAVEALSAWKYESYFGTAKVGIVDSGVLVDHEDFDDLISFPNSTYKNGNVAAQHGTHVAGIIGATRNNGIGGSGLLSDVEIYAASYTIGSANTTSNVVNGVTAHVEHGAKAVNISLGISKGGGSDTYNPYLDVYTDFELASTAGQCAQGMNALLDQGLEFVVVQSAGNGTIDTRVGSASYRSDDATQNGLYCSVKKDGYKYPTYYGSLTENDILQVYNRIIVVGAVQRIYKSGQVHLYMWERSNGGERVDIYAPGKSVFSTITDTVDNGILYKYAGMSGTSQAAPIVTAVAAMCFAINPNFTGAQVKNIICDEANSTHTALDYSLGTGVYDENGKELDYHPFEGDGRVVSMKLCAEAALRYVCGKANYRYFNQVMSAVQSLDPNSYTNYEVIQAVIDSIDDSFYELYEFEQEKVTAKANELVAAMDKLIEREPADYTEVEKAKAEAAALNASHYVDFSDVTAAVNAVVYGKYADEQAEVDLMAKNIRDAITALEVLVSISSYDINITPDNTNRLLVLAPDYVQELTPFLTAGAWSVTHNENSNGNYSTGSTVTLTDAQGNDSGVVYTVVVIGDINGDCKADGEDAFIASLYANGMLTADSAAKLAACDADCSGTVDENDFLLLERCGLEEDYIYNFYQGAD